jgi:hypothetical protein
VLYLLARAPTELGSGAIWIVSFLVVFYATVIAVFVRHIGTVLTAMLEERDPRQKEILREVLREVLRDLLDLFRRGKHR